MNHEQAKEILSAYRPGTDDERDPVFAEALELARRDPELAAWLKDQQAFDAAVRRRLVAVRVAPELLDEIRAGVSRRYRAVYRRREFLTALAACLVLLLTVAGVWWYRQSQRPTTQFAACRRDMVQFLHQFPRLDLETENLAQARQWLADTHHLRQVQIPAGLQRFPTIGCRTIEWRGRSLALVCFVVDGEIVHFILIPRSSIPDGPQTSEPQFARVNGTTTAAWSRGDLTYLVLTKASEKFLRERM
ncbi:MAG: hypothetical protein KGJ60_01770 [Verrucomicrobiota bacterium]|nr:hypothetical protein [Verrucomicrobiota bacterium]